ncbi:MAG: succinate dehydrogenase assembly factor 2 [Alphaproteobacteria bacterium]|nr:succinate dehydrogenase assembly factor 2 [Alphaproteobacteria bacterium]
MDLNAKLTIEERRRMLIFRSWHRGTREMDILMGAFADAYVPNFDAAQLDEYERVLTCQDPDLYDWKCGRAEPPADEDCAVLRLFLAHKVAA